MEFKEDEEPCQETTDLVSVTCGANLIMKTLDTLRSLHHEYCIVCGAASQHGLGLRCQVTDEKEVVATFDCRDLFQGYPDMLHGGVISSLLDGAMTQCMFARGEVAVTVELRVRFRHPVATDCDATIRAWLVEQRSSLYFLKAELVQCEQVMARAEGKFVKRPNSENGR